MNAARKIARANVLHRAAAKAVKGETLSEAERAALEKAYRRRGQPS